MVDEASRKAAPRRESFRDRKGWGLSEVLFTSTLLAALAGVVYCGRFAYSEGSLLETAKGNAQTFVRWAEGVAAANEKGAAFTPQACSVRLVPPPPPPESAAGVLPEGTVARAGDAASGAAPAQAASAAVVLVGLSMLPAKAGEGPGEQIEESAPAAAQAAPAAAADPPAPTWKACRDALFAAGGPMAGLTNPFNVANGVIGPKCERKSALTRGVVLVDKGTPTPPGTAAPVVWSPIEEGEAVVKGLMLRVRVCDAGGYALAVAEVTL